MCALGAAAACLLPGTAASQTLEEQYAHFLAAKCSAMNFERGGFEELLPGQAGPGLQAFCSGSPVVQGVGSRPSSASNGTGSAGTEDGVAQRRREARSEESSTSSGGRNSVFASLQHATEDQQPMHFEGGMRSRVLQLTAGMDRRLGPWALVGAALRVDDLTGDFDAGGDFSHRGYTAMLYGSWQPVRAAFVDLSAGATLRDIRVDRVVSFTRYFVPITEPPTPPPYTIIESIPPGVASSDQDQDEVLLQLQAGHDFSRGSNAIGPRLGVEYRRTDTDAMVESGTTPMTLAFDSQVEKSLRTGAGVQASRVVSTDSAVLLLQLNADWWHEFEDDQRFIEAHFAQDLRSEPSRLRYQNQPPDRDVFTVRASLGLTMREGWSAFATADVLLGHAYRHRYGVALGVRKQLQ